jgi:phosphatidylglycerol---prolipoprotein diacylglyceryl transferase
VWDLGPIPIRAYALCIILGIVASIWISERRWVARGGKNGTVSDIAVWAVIFGLVGGRLYHVITDNELYFRAGRDPWRAFYVWEGGLGVWGAIALGAVGAWIGCHRRGITLPPFADACAPGIAVAQGIGRWGNYFNQELFGRPTNLPWAVHIDPDRPSTVPGVTNYQPTFLYESVWDLALAAVLVYVDRRYKMGRGRVFALYVMGYCVGRVWIEALRIDTANHILGLRLNVWTSIIVFAGGLIYFLLHPGPREREVEPGMVLVTPDGAEVTDDEDAPASTGATAADTTDAETTDAESEDAESKDAESKDAEPEGAEPAEDDPAGDDPAEDDLAEAERADDELAYGEPPETEPAEDEPATAESPNDDDKPTTEAKSTPARKR